MTAEPQLDLDVLTDGELRELVALPEGKEGLRYYLSKEQKKDFIRACEAGNEKTMEKLIVKARKAQEEHHRYLNQRRKSGPRDKAKMIEDKLKGGRWRYLEREHIAKGFRDACTGRKAKLAYVLENPVSGEVIRVCRSTVDDAHERLNVILNWPPQRSTGGEPRIAPGGTTAAALPLKNRHLHTFR